MIVIAGSVTAKPGWLDVRRRLALAHLERSRTEPGCVSHTTAVDPVSRRYSA